MPDDRATEPSAAAKRIAAECLSGLKSKNHHGNGAPERTAFALDDFAAQAVQSDRARIAEWLTQAEARGRLGKALRAMQEGRWFTDE